MLSCRPLEARQKCILEVNQSNMPMVYHLAKLLYYYREKHFRREKLGCRHIGMIRKTVLFGTHSMAIKAPLRINPSVHRRCLSLALFIRDGCPSLSLL